MSDEWLKYLPHQWVGIMALVMFGFYVSMQLIEKSAVIAKIFPLGTWWHERQKLRNRPAHDDSEAVEALERRVSSLARTSLKQDEDIARLQSSADSLQSSVDAFTAWSVYDSIWHHRTAVINAQTEACKLPKHHDFFDFERIWRNDPLAAARLSEA